MESFLSLLGSLGLIFFTLVSVTMLVDFLMKGYYVYALQASREDADSKKKGQASFMDFLVGLMSECEEQKVWLSALWTRPFAIVLALAVVAAGHRFSMGLSLTAGLATLVFVAVAFAVPAQIAAAKSVLGAISARMPRIGSRHNKTSTRP